MALEEIRAKIPINWELVKNPTNWAIVFLMIAFAGLAIKFISMQAGNSLNDQDN